MKTLKILLLFAVLAIVAACDKENPEPPGNPGVGDGTYIGTLTVDQNDRTLYIQNNVTVEVTMADGKASIKMLQVKFSERMPLTLTMTIPGVDAVEATDGFSLSGDGIIPLAMGGDFPQYTITEMTGSLSAASLAFDLMCGEYPLTFAGTVKTE